MKTVHFAKNQNLSRRTLLRGVGVAMALPWLDSMAPAFGQKAKAAIKKKHRVDSSASATRMGLEIDGFASATGTMRGIEMKS